MKATSTITDFVFSENPHLPIAPIVSLTESIVKCFFLFDSYKKTVPQKKWRHGFSRLKVRRWLKCDCHGHFFSVPQNGYRYSVARIYFGKAIHITVNFFDLAFSDSQ